MEEELVSLSVAILAKEKGFNEVCYHHFGCDEDSFGGKDRVGSRNSQWATCCTRPTQSLLQRWLREEYNIDITVALVANGYGFYIHRNRKYTNDGDSYGVSGHTYEQALEEGLQEALKLI